MKKILFFAFAISAVAMISCSDDEGTNGGNGCTCTSTISGVNTSVDYSSDELDRMEKSNCSDLETYLNTQASGYYTVTCVSK